jgi:hypothetical protein
MNTNFKSKIWILDLSVMSIISAQRWFLRSQVRRGHKEHIEEVSTSILSEGDDNNEWGIQQTPELSSNICKVTWCLVTRIKSVWNNYSQLNRIVRVHESLAATLSVLKYRRCWCACHKFDSIGRKHVQYLYLQINLLKTGFKCLSNDINYIS